MLILELGVTSHVSDQTMLLGWGEEGGGGGIHNSALSPSRNHGNHWEFYGRNTYDMNFHRNDLHSRSRRHISRKVEYIFPRLHIQTAGRRSALEMKTTGNVVSDVGVLQS